MSHGGIAHDAGFDHLRTFGPNLLQQVSEQFIQSLLDFFGQHLPALRITVDVAEAADDILAIADLRVGHPARGQVCAAL